MFGTEFRRALLFLLLVNVLPISTFPQAANQPSAEAASKFFQTIDEAVNREIANYYSAGGEDWFARASGHPMGHSSLRVQSNRSCHASVYGSPAPSHVARWIKRANVGRQTAPFRRKPRTV